MAEEFDSDTCLGFKRRISELPGIEINHSPVEEQHSKSLSPEQPPSEKVSTVEEERESESGLLKKPKCSSSDESEHNVFVRGKQETEEANLGFAKGSVIVGESGSQLVSEMGKELKNSDGGSFGNRDFGMVQKNSSSRLSAEEIQKPFVVEDGEKGLLTSCVTFDEIGSQSFLKMEGGERLVEPTVESITDSMTHASEFTDVQCESEITCHDRKIREAIDISSWVLDEKLGTVVIPYTGARRGVCDGMIEMEDGGRGKVGGLKGNGETAICSLKIEVIDETAVIETTSARKVGNDVGKYKGSVGIAKHSERNAHKNNVMKQETGGKKEKRPRRRGKGAKMLSGTNGMEPIVVRTDKSQDGCEKKGDEGKRGYSREEMEALRFVNFGAQKIKWSQVYCGLPSTVAREYDGLIDCSNQKHIRVDFDPRPQFGRKEKAQGVLGRVAAKGRGTICLVH